MDNGYSKNVDTHIRELQEEDKVSRKFIILCFIMMSLGSLILFIFNFFIQNPILDKAADFWPIFWIVVLFIAVIKWGRSSRKLRSMMAQKICIDDVLNQYLQVEIFDPERAVDNKILNAAGIYSMGTGNNYIKGIVNGCSIETSYVYVTSNDNLGGGQDHWYTGQLSYLKNKSCFSEHLLLLRTGDYSKYGIGRIYYENLEDLPRRHFQPTKSFIDSLREKEHQQYRITIYDGPLNSQWKVFSTDPAAAGRLLDPHTDFYRRLLNSPQLAFVLYRDDDIYFGGNYYFDLSKGTPEEVRAKVEEAMDGLINEGVGTVLSAEYQ